MLLYSKKWCKNDIDDDKENHKSVSMYLNVYDLTPINVYAYWLGLRVYHSSVQVHGVEYAFGAHEFPTTGIFEAKPKHCDWFSFRKIILIEKTEMGPTQVRFLMEELAEKYKENSYNLITKSCNHFCNDACVRLTSNPIPNWVNRLSRIGFLCNCVLPATLNATKVPHHRMENKQPSEGETKKLTSGSNRFTSSNSSSLSSSPAQTRGRSRSRRRALPPPSPLIIGSSSS